jgi:hypothetical protein
MFTYISWSTFYVEITGVLRASPLLRLDSSTARGRASLRGAPRVISDGSYHRLPAAGLHGSDDCMLAELDEMPPVETGGADRHHC